MTTCKAGSLTHTESTFKRCSYTRKGIYLNRWSLTLVLVLLFNFQKDQLQGVSPGRLHNEENNPQLLLTDHPSNCKYEKTELLVTPAKFKLVAMFRKMSTELYLLYCTSERMSSFTDKFQNKVNKVSK